MNNPLITIIIPIYNVASYLEECLDSVINQTYKNLDIILVDDGSTDESLNIALKYLNKDERIFLISKENGGQSSARNTGLEFIKGTKLRTFFENNNEEDITSFTSTHTFEKNTKILKKEDIKSNFMQIQKRYIKTNLENINDFIIQELPNTIIHFLDSDDYLLQDCIELCVKEMIEKDLDICAHGLQEYKNKEFIKKDFFEKTFEGEFYNPLDLLKLNKKYNFYFAWQGVFKANILNQYNLRFTHGIYHEDHDFGTILFCLAKKMFYDRHNYGYIYKLNLNSTMSSQKKSHFPKKMPKFLTSIKHHFKTYKSLRLYYKVYSFSVVALQIYNFTIYDKYKNDSFLQNMIYEYCNLFKISLKKDPLNILTIYKNMKLDKYKLFSSGIKKLLRHPKKIFYISNFIR
ncbi:glycosyltransferase family 2 protein [Campylobacter volucris]|uniref:Glycosyltransferase family 2 protein n=1 Tax=Campylobacter volucris TaxID=1031542 RepID=A0A5C7E216_9BACT|nr:glycosyltransferase family A protein [Campylobacter volucris]TXE88610.1 glycosyltransferase family 2 protein [Campylobacter volucris]